MTEMNKTAKMKDEQAIGVYISRLIKENIGKGPSLIKVKIRYDLIDISIAGYYPPLLESLSTEEPGIAIIEKIIFEYLRRFKEQGLANIAQILGKEVKVLHGKYDIKRAKGSITLIIE